MKRLLNNIYALFIVFIVVAIIIPLPPLLLDFLLVVNIALSLVIMLTTMYIKEALQFSVFPTILLITTIFRLSLNVSTTRNILAGQGADMNIIEAFGTFVMGGDPIIGFIVFIIIVIVQFLVIVKGSERVSEVAARFTLDAMPGKQMAIDADLNSGLISESEAKERRFKIQREADFYGSMDGATKFVKGDAIISIIVAVINLIGGAAIGMLREGGQIMDIINSYSLYTVGDGLCSQIPALLISVATGMIVTRSASTSTLNEDLKLQFTSQPSSLIVGGMVIGILGIVPGFPTLVMLAVGAVMLFLGYRLMDTVKEAAVVESLAEQKSQVSAELEAAKGDTEYYRDIDNVFKLLSVEQVEMEFGYSLLHLVDSNNGGNFIDRVVIFRKQFAIDMGMVIPSVRMRDNPEINPNQYLIKIKGEEVARGEILVDHFLALDSGSVIQEVDGIDTIEPAFGIPARWISEDKKSQADIAGYTLIDPVSVMITHLSEIMKSHAHELISRQDVKSMVDNLSKVNPTLVEDVVPGIVTIGYLHKILSMLLKESIPIRDLETILQTIGDHAAAMKDMDIITEYVRQALKRTITRRFAEANSLKVITIDAAVEDKIVTSVKKSDQGSYLSIDPDTIHKIIQSTTNEIDKIKDVVPTIIVLTSPVVRTYFKKLADQFVPNITVLSYSEIDSTTQIQALGNISF